MVKISQEDIEFAYLCGLMHDTGILVFDHLIPDEYSEFLGTIKSSDITLAENEAETFGITHAELGALFIEKWWPVSPGLVEAIRSRATRSENGARMLESIIEGELLPPVSLALLEKLAAREPVTKVTLGDPAHLRRISEGALIVSLL